MSFVAGSKTSYLGLLWLVLFIKTDGSGVAILELIRYENPTGKGANGNCCDSYWGYCTGRSSHCDYYFVICLDKPDGTSSLQNCAIGSRRTRSLSNMNVVVFGRSIGGTPNPLRFPFRRWYTDGVRIKIDVYDDDPTGSDDFVQYYNKVVLVHPGQSQVLTFTGRTSLTFKLKVVCDPDWYGNDCSTKCLPQQDDFLGHFDCSPDSGQKVCHPGWQGPNCTINVDECLSSPCGDRGECQDAANSYHCDCYYGYTGKNCEVITDGCISRPCQNGATCLSYGDQHMCICPTYYTGSNCEAEVDPCQSEPCQNGASCIRESESFRCLCAPGFTGHDCRVDIDECASDPCLNNGSCVDVADAYQCLCPAGFSGNSCEVNINDCEDEPCGVNGICVDGVDSYICACHDGWTGENCTTLVSECQSEPCRNNGTCVDLASGYACHCPSGYTGTDCDEVVDPCLSDPCRHGGTCVSAAGSYVCTCDVRYTGSQCDVESSHCQSRPCVNNGTCLDTESGYRCSCSPGWTGKDCRLEIDPCLSSPCHNEGTCISQHPGYNCVCAADYSGALCQNRISGCSSSFCQNGATCVSTKNGYSCSCPPYFTGKVCEHEINLTEKSEEYKTIHFLGRLGIYEGKVFLSVLRNLTAARLNISGESLRITDEMEYCQDSEGHTVTVLRFLIHTSTNAAVPRFVYDGIFQDINGSEGKGIVPLPLHHGDCYLLPKVAGSSETQKFWIMRKWPLVAALSSVILIVIVLTVAALAKSRSRRRPSGVQVNTNPGYDPRPSVISGDPGSCAYSEERDAFCRASYMGTERFHELQPIILSTAQSHPKPML